MPSSDYKPNSHKYHEQNMEKEPEVRTASKPKVKEHLTIGQRFKELFFAESFKTVIIRVLQDQFVPMLQDIIVSIVDSMVHGYSGRGRSSSSYYEGYHKPYNSSSKTSRVRPRSNFSTDRFSFETRREAQDILRQLNERCARYDGVCAVSYFYDCIDYERPLDDWVLDKWGWSWKALDRARIYQRHNGEWVLSISEPDVVID